MITTVGFQQTFNHQYHSHDFTSDCRTVASLTLYCTTHAQSPNARVSTNYRFTVDAESATLADRLSTAVVDPATSKSKSSEMCNQ